MLHDSAEAKTIPETSIIIEYLQDHYPGATVLLPPDGEARREARLWDRFFDLYVSTPMQKIVTDRIRPEASRDPFGVAEARAALENAYAMIETQVAGKRWAAGDSFSLADCAAAPALFFASIVHPIGATFRQVPAYLDRLLERPSVRRAIGEATPYFDLFPYRDAMPPRFLAL